MRIPTPEVNPIYALSQIFNLTFYYLCIQESNNSFIMKEIKTKRKDKSPTSKSWILPGKTLSQDEFLTGIQEAEKGPFQTVQESMENFEVWLKSREKK